MRRGVLSHQSASLPPSIEAGPVRRRTDSVSRDRRFDWLVCWSGAVMANILWSFTSQRGCYEPALAVISELRRRGHHVLGVTTSPDRSQLPFDIEVVADRFLAPPPVLRAPTSGAPTPATLEDALARKSFLAGWHKSEVEQLIQQHNIDIVLADGFRLGAGFAAER